MSQASDKRVARLKDEALIAWDLARNPRQDKELRMLALGGPEEQEMGRDRLKSIKSWAKRRERKAERVDARHTTGWIGRLIKWLNK